jgi:hypothetical protein
LQGLLPIDNGDCTWPLFGNQRLDTALIEIWQIVAEKPIFFFNKNNNIAVVMRLLISSRYKLPFRLLANPANRTYL